MWLPHKALHRTGSFYLPVFGMKLRFLLRVLVIHRSVTLSHPLPPSLSWDRTENEEKKNMKEINTVVEDRKHVTKWHFSRNIKERRTKLHLFSYLPFFSGPSVFDVGRFLSIPLNFFQAEFHGALIAISWCLWNDSEIKDIFEWLNTTQKGKKVQLLVFAQFPGP